MRLRGGDVGVDEFGTAGAYLSAAREAGGESVAEVAERTRIRPDFIAAIEANDVGALPTAAFAVGFVRTYAEHLGLDADAVVKRFRDDIGGRPSDDLTRAADAATPAVAEEARARPRLSFLAVLGVIAFMIWCAYEITRPRQAGDPPSGPPGLPTMQSQSPAGPRLVGARGTLDATSFDAQDPTVVNLGAFRPADVPAMIDAKALQTLEPIYPRACVPEAEAEETVVVGYTITAAGTVVAERIVEASNACFRRASLNAVRRWRFKPRTVDGAPTPAYEMRHTFTFKRPA